MRGIPVLGNAVGPAPRAGVLAVRILLHRREDVAAVDPAVTVDVGDLPRSDVAGVVQILEGDQAVAVGVHEIGETRGGDFFLIDPDILIQIGVIVVDAGVDGSDHGFRRTRADVPGRGGIDAAGAVQSPEAAVRVTRVVWILGDRFGPTLDGMNPGNPVEDRDQTLHFGRSARGFKRIRQSGRGKGRVFRRHDRAEVEHRRRKSIKCDDQPSRVRVEEATGL